MVSCDVWYNICPSQLLLLFVCGTIYGVLLACVDLVIVVVMALAGCEPFVYRLCELLFVVLDGGGWAIGVGFVGCILLIVLVWSGVGFVLFCCSLVSLIGSRFWYY